MAIVLQLTRRLETRPAVPQIAGVRLRHFAGPEDVSLWLSIREGAFARQTVGVRHWDASDFAAEFLEKPWWDPQGIWFAEVLGGPARPGETERRPDNHRAVGTISLAWRGSPPEARPAIHWLAVLRGHRRRGIARLLLSALEAACWDRGHRQVWLETHAGWTEAIEFYRALGYRSTADELHR